MGMILHSFSSLESSEEDRYCSKLKFVETEDGKHLDDRHMIKRRSIARRPIRSKNRHSILSIQSTASAVSSEEGNTSDYPCSSSQRSTLESNPEFNTQQLRQAFEATNIAMSTSDERRVPSNGNAICSNFLPTDFKRNENDIRVESAESMDNSDEEEDTEVISQAPSMTPRQTLSLTNFED